jgi:hypothetical protein
MMTIKSAFAAAALALSAVGPAQAVPISYEGTIAAGTPVTGSVTGNGWETETAAGVDFWRFNGVVGQSFSVRGTRLDPNLDPVLTLYFGTTTADASQFLHDADWGGLVFLRVADDEVSVASGPGGDPLLSNYLLPFTGLYTIAIGGIGSNGAGPFNYSMQTTQIAAVPEPETVMLMTTGLGLLLMAQRRRKARRA